MRRPTHGVPRTNQARRLAATVQSLLIHHDEPTAPTSPRSRLPNEKREGGGASPLRIGGGSLPIEKIVSDRRATAGPRRDCEDRAADRPGEARQRVVLGEAALQEDELAARVALVEEQQWS